MALRFRAVWIPQLIVGVGAALAATGTFWMFFTGQPEPALTLTFWGMKALIPGLLLWMLSGFTSKNAPIARLAIRRGLATFLAGAGLLLCATTILAIVESSDYQALYFARVLGIPLLAVGGLLLCVGVVLGASLDKRWPVELDRERTRNIALARGAQPGDLMEAPAESSAGNLSEAETPGAVSIARAEKAKL